MSAAPLEALIGRFGVMPSDEVVSRVRQCPQVPDAEYLVCDGRVFVFSALIRALRQHAHGLTDLTDRALGRLVDRVLSKAWMAPLSAVVNYGVRPRYIEPVSLRLSSGGIALGLWHRGFMALLPRAFESKLERDKALSLLLTGEVLGAEAGGVGAGHAIDLVAGDCRLACCGLRLADDYSIQADDPAFRVVIAGQSYLLLSPMQLDEPSLVNATSAAPLAPSVLSDLAPAAEWAEVDQDAFANLQRVAEQWAGVREWVRLLPVRISADLYREVVARVVPRLLFGNRLSGFVPLVGDRDFSELSTLYPELGPISPDVLGHLWRGYEVTRLGFAGIARPYRDSLFSAYVVGAALGADVDHPTHCVESGCLCISNIADGQSVDFSISISSEWAKVCLDVEGKLDRVRQTLVSLADLRRRPSCIGRSLDGINSEIFGMHGVDAM